MHRRNQRTDYPGLKMKKPTFTGRALSERNALAGATEVDDMLYKPEQALPQGDAIEIHRRSSPPLSLADWANRDLAEPDFILGNWLSTTNRTLLGSAPTGLGKTNFAIALGMRVAAGTGFLHWRGRRQAQVLYVDGEMSCRLLKRRLTDEARRLGSSPTGFHALCLEDLDSFSPLNTAEGQSAHPRYIDKDRRRRSGDLRSVMCLLAGSMIDETLGSKPCHSSRLLTKRNVGQIWVHHTGHNEARGYGTKTREWQMDSVVHLEAAKRDETERYRSNWNSRKPESGHRKRGVSSKRCRSR